MLLIPVFTGLLGYAIGRLRNEFSFIGIVLNLYYAVRLFFRSRQDIVIYKLADVARIPVFFRLDKLSGSILLFVAATGILVILFSFRYMKNWKGTRGYYLYMLLVLSGANGVLLAGNLPVMFFFWGALLVVLYGMLLIGRSGADKTACKAVVVLGLSDFVMLLGIAILVIKNGWIDLAPRVPMGLYDPMMVAAFVLIVVGALAKAGSMPLHTWIPEASRTAPATVMALIPASLCGLLGIYLLIRLSVYVFNIGSNMVLQNVLMAIGAVTVVAAVMMALVQHRVMKILAFDMISQVGYVLIGIGTGTPIGIAGGLFCMLNNSVYGAGLFLSAGSVEYWSKSDEVDKLGGLARQMPVTFASFLVFALAIAGVPPLNGFFSKWMVYQGVINIGGSGNRLFPFFLVAAMLGSVLTLASFLKLTHTIFLGRGPKSLAKAREGSFTMWLPTAVLAIICIVYGVFAYQVPLPDFIYPSLPFCVEPFGIWQPVLTTLLILISLGIGALIYLFGTARKPIEVRAFVGGEKIAESEEGRVTGAALYSSLKRLPVISWLLRLGAAGAFDLYNWLMKLLVRCRCVQDIKDDKRAG